MWWLDIKIQFYLFSLFKKLLKNNLQSALVNVSSKLIKGIQIIWIGIVYKYSIKVIDKKKCLTINNYVVWFILL